MDKAALVVNILFRHLAAIFPAFKQAWPTQDDFDFAKKEWIKSFIQANITDIEQIREGVNKFRLMQSPFVPSPGQFIAMCRSDKYPTLEYAYNEACLNSHPTGEKKWTNFAIKEAAKRMGSHYFRTMPRRESIKLFEYHYDIVLRSIDNGQLIEQPLVAIANPEKKSTCTPSVAQKALADIKKMLSQ